ncbi:hypothetical protein [Sphingomonas oligoaromativorans]|uniref:hypothetical protein n=1 Tax=Sphingomonas oligoaromativorans TaxID=575322 RepID=UPI001ABB4CBE|nr:hypothetical protein [Sphingomonas oligoaromativorans]NIJ33602.1 hypothetical protein [Sphingomonas oligoaromativorans]
MRNEVIERAAEIEAAMGRPDIDEALKRWQAAGGAVGGRSAAPWVSVAFLFGRRLRLAA